MIIGLSGKKGCGKNEVGEFLCSLFGDDEVFLPDNGGNKHSYPIPRAECMALADPIKRIACDYFGMPEWVAWGTQEIKEETFTEWKWDDIPSGSKEGHMTARELLQYIGTEIFRHNMHKDFWIRATLNLIKKAQSERNPPKHFIITDVRFPNEADMVTKNGKLIRIWGRGVSGDAHPSETSLDHHDDILRSLIPPVILKEEKVIALKEFNLDRHTPFDFILQNDGSLDDLKDNARVLVDILGI